MNSLSFIPSLSETNFNTVVAGDTKPLVLIFKTDWFGTTYIMAPILQSIVKEFQGRVRFFAVDYEDNQALALRYDVQNIITHLFFLEGAVVHKLIGPVSANVIRSAINAVFFTIGRLAGDK